MKRQRKNKHKCPLLEAKTNSGRKVRKNASVTMSLKALRRMLGAARTGKKTSVKARVR